ncbi:oxidoreductase [Denitratisoma sp. DHT3]|uniref:SDR family NAD(P)-dependent oxidoreductase n=1 Tax=Denitratisoma sp. DHT3 TaxID=1981880 RepID=UPI001198AA9A|nr:SDR family NAD(P)-dependent oxidoreductase [Denitratisoma sp. DHT3]QDX82435.1 oxidoreductase [Denitratisoma sp. DHT3]
MNLLQDKIALVTGASRGIGRAIARRLASEGATVVVTARSLDRAGEFAGTLHETVALIEAAGGRAIALAADLEKPAERDGLVARTVRAAGGLDILVNNAGIADYAPTAEMPMAMFDATLDHYLRAPFALIQQAVPEMRRRGAGWIVMVGSCTALPPGKPYDIFARLGGATVYAAAKAAVHRFTQGLAAELQADDIAVNAVAPSTAISTPGADRWTPADYPTEPVEYLAETALALCHRPAAERTGLVTYSLHFPLAMNLPVHSLDGRELLPPPVIPPYAHTGISGTGE